MKSEACNLITCKPCLTARTEGYKVWWEGRLTKA